MPIQRRELVRLGAGAGIAALAGCLGSLGDSTDGDEPADGPNDNSSDTTSDDGADDTGSDEEDAPDDAELAFDPADSEYIDHAAIVTDGDEHPDAADSYVVSVRNDTDEDQSISARIAFDDEDIFEETVAVPAETGLEVIASEPGTYETSVESEETGSETTTTISWSGGDCGESYTTLTFGEGGIGTETSIAC